MGLLFTPPDPYAALGSGEHGANDGQQCDDLRTRHEARPPGLRCRGGMRPGESSSLLCSLAPTSAWGIAMANSGERRVERIVRDLGANWGRAIQDQIVEAAVARGRARLASQKLNPADSTIQVRVPVWITMTFPVRDGEIMAADGGVACSCTEPQEGVCLCVGPEPAPAIAPSSHQSLESAGPVITGSWLGGRLDPGDVMMEAFRVDKPNATASLRRYPCRSSVQHHPRHPTHRAVSIGRVQGMLY
jgi:hypothetical protein